MNQTRLGPNDRPPAGTGNSRALGSTRSIRTNASSEITIETRPTNMAYSAMRRAHAHCSYSMIRAHQRSPFTGMQAGLHAFAIEYTLIGQRSGDLVG